MPPYARVTNTPPSFPEPDGLSPLLDRVLRPKPVADAMNPLLGLRVNPPPETLAQPVYPQTEQLGPTMQKASLLDSPLPPARPAGLGSILSRAVVPSTPPRAAAAPVAAVAPAASSAFTGMDRANSGPNDRFRGGGTALDLSGLLGGLFGGGGAAPNPTPPPPPAAPAGARGRQAPDMSGVAFDENGNPVPDYGLFGPGLQPQNPTQLAGTVSKPGWWKGLR